MSTNSDHHHNSLYLLSKWSEEGECTYIEKWWVTGSLETTEYSWFPSVTGAAFSPSTSQTLDKIPGNISITYKMGNEWCFQDSNTKICLPCCSLWEEKKCGITTSKGSSQSLGRHHLIVTIISNDHPCSLDMRPNIFEYRVHFHTAKNGPKPHLTRFPILRYS